MENFNGITKWLFERAYAGFCPQIGVADDHKRALSWWPGKKDKSVSWRPDALRIKYLGCTNRAYPFPCAAMGKQPGVICWAGLDIDGGDNPHLTFDSLVDLVWSIVHDHASIRTSCGGKGLHVLFRLEQPVEFGAGVESAAISKVTKALSKPWADNLTAAGVHICKSDSRMFWLMGGANRWLHRTAFLLPEGLVKDLLGQAVVLAEKEEEVRVPEHVGPFVADWLVKLNSRPGPVYVGTLVTRLRALGETVVTRSGCSGNGEVNGYIDCGPGWIQLWSYADGHAIWKAVDVDGLLGGD